MASTSAESETAASGKVTASEKSQVTQGSVRGSEDFERSDGHLSGWRFWLTMVPLYAAQFLTTLEMSIVTTALVAITNDLQDFKHATWTANAYFVAWSGTLVLWAQFSHTVGRKLSFLLSFGGFVIFSAACAAAQTATELYVFRGLQGLAGAGVFSLPMVIISEAVPPSRIPLYTSVVALIAVIAFAAGPLIGGAIAARTTWRWVFILNVPPGTLAFLTIMVALPNAFPHQHKPVNERPRFKLSSLAHLDSIGGLLFLGISVLTVTALQEADTTYAWNSPTIICLLVFGGLSFITFVFWERYITAHKPKIMPILTYHFVQRKTIAMFASSFLIGFPFLSTMVQIPQRLQVLDDQTPLKAAIHLLPYTVLQPVGATLGAVLSKGKLQSRPIYLQLVGALLQLIAVICFTVDHNYLLARQYGFQILMGLGSGLAYTANFTGMYYSIGGKKELIAPAVGANSQFRYLGAAMGLGTVTAAFNTYIRSHLSDILSPDQIALLLQSSRLIPTLSAEDRARLVQVFTNGFVLQWKIMCGFVGLQIVAILLTY